MIASSSIHPRSKRTLAESAEDSPEISREPLTGGGQRIVLPFRQLGESKKYGWIVFGFGVFATLFMVGWIGGPLAVGVGLLMDGQLFGLLPVAFSFLGIMGLRCASLMLAGGWAATQNRTRTVIEVREEKLIAIEEFYWLKWKRKCKLDRIEQLAYKTKWDDKRDSNVTIEEFGGALVATQTNEDPFPVAVAYPRDVLIELAELLATQFDKIQIANASLQTGDELSKQLRQRIEVLELGPEETEPVDKPDDTDLELVRHETGIKIDGPPTGFKSAIGAFSVLWLAFATLFLVLMIFGKANGGESDLIAWLVVSLFEAVGIGMFLWAYNAGRKRTSVVTAGDRVLFVSDAPFGKRRQEWNTNQLYEIRVGDSGVSVNDEPVQELQFHDRTENKFGCLCERTDDELRWIAYELNNALGMETVSARPIELSVVSRDAKGRAIPSPTSSIVVEHEIKTSTIRVPGRGRKPFTGLAVNGIFFILSGTGMAALFVWHERNVFNVIIPVALCALFSLAGAAAVTLSVVLAQRGYVVQADPNALRMERTGWLSAKSMQWQRVELKSVGVIDSGTKIGNRSLKQLKIQGHNGSSFGGMTDHSLEDLSFVAVAINEMMALDSES